MITDKYKSEVRSSLPHTPKHWLHWQRKAQPHLQLRDRLCSYISYLSHDAKYSSGLSDIIVITIHLQGVPPKFVRRLAIWIPYKKKNDWHARSCKWYGTCNCNLKGDWSEDWCWSHGSTSANTNTTPPTESWWWGDQKPITHKNTCWPDCYRSMSR